MLTFKRPMLAATLLKPTDKHDDATILAAMKCLRYPVAATLKIDGIRALRLNSSLLSRRLKPIPNVSIRERSLKLPAGFDMELYNPELQYDEIESIVMSREHSDSDKIQFWVLDWFKEGPYDKRISEAFFHIENILAGTLYFDTYCEYPTICYTAEELLVFEHRCIEQHGEGICFRLFDSPYIQKDTLDNRSTLAEQYLVKLSRFIRQEVTVIGFYEANENTNSDKRNALGMMDRSSFKSGMVGKGTLGGFYVRDSTGLEFKVGGGSWLTKLKRQGIWDNQSRYLGMQIVVKHKPHGKLIKPRQPQALGPRSEIDL